MSFWIGVLLLSLGIAAAPPEPPPLRVIYFIPSDRDPLPGYQGRLDRVMTEVQRFYREGMQAAGYGAKTFALERDEEGRLRLYLVQGIHPMREYGRNDAAKVRREVKDALAQQGIDADRETIVIFQVLLAWEGDRATEIGPYVGGGNYLSGTAWVYDDPRLDPQLLPSKEPGGYYNGPCSLGQFNTHYIGGTAHELGHAFGLPHDCETRADRSVRGRSLMGSGNHTYGQELRNEGPGTFLSAASAMQLAFIRAFSGEQPDARVNPNCRWTALDARFDDGKMILTGAVEAQPPAFGLVALNDGAAPPADYDAVGWTATIDEQGRFQVEIGELQSGRSQLRLRVCHVNGAQSVFAFDYDVDGGGKPRLDVFRMYVPLRRAMEAFSARDRKRLEELATDYREQLDDLPELRRRLAHLLRLLEAPAPRPLADIPPDQDGWVPISGAAFRSATTGWGRPLRDQVLVERGAPCFLQVGGQFFEHGLFAHAPSKYELELDGKFGRFRAGYGLQDGHEGSVVFVVRGDGRELFRSPLIRDSALRRLDLGVENVRVLELVVETGDDGPRSDWGVWIEPQLKPSGQ